MANVIIFICGNLAGAYHKHLMELALQQTYQDTCNCIKSRIKLEFEKRQQVRSYPCLICIAVTVLFPAQCSMIWLASGGMPTESYFMKYTKSFEQGFVKFASKKEL